MDHFPCPHTGDVCQRGDCPTTACVLDLDPAVWPDCEPDPMDLGETVPWPMGAEQ